MMRILPSHTLLFLFIFFQISLLCSPISAQNNLGRSCSTTSNYTTNSTYQTNLNLLLSTLKANSTQLGFYNSTIGDDPDRVYGLILCRGDATPDQCLTCANTASQGIKRKCPHSKNATIWYNYCMIRYSSVRFFSILDNSIKLYRSNAINVSDPDQFNQVLIGLMRNLTSAAAWGNQTRKFAAGNDSFSNFQRVFGLVQCTRDLSTTDCNACLQNQIAYIPECCDGKQGGWVLGTSCNLRYEVYPFFDDLTVTGLTPFRPRVEAAPPEELANITDSKGISSQAIIAIVVPTFVGGGLFFSVVYLILLRRKANTKSLDGHAIGDMDSLQFDLSTIKAATHNFSDENKLGQGGFGAVYKGRLPNGQEIAVKRLFRSTREGLEEFKNEVALVAKLQHRNLVRLLGCCLEGNEQLLIFEYVSNKSLDAFLFDETKRVCLDWEKRFKIISGIARGLLYLHEDSRLKIIHRDLKASNILLDEEMNAKISDFGTARLCEVGQTQGCTTRVTGTYGYMAPEYAMHGKFSIKSDVFSFGVLLLEIVTGLENYGFYRSDLEEDLPSYVWRLWRERTASKLVDPTLRECGFTDEGLRCIQIGLLCVQENLSERPTMSSVVQMLSNDTVILRSPFPPVFSMVSRVHTNPNTENYSSDQSESRPIIPSSSNEISSAELDPR